MKAMILAAGLGTRLRPLTDRMPKPLLPVGGAPLIVWNLLLLRKHGIADVVVNLHHLGNLIEQALEDGARWGMRIVYSREPTILGTGGGIKQAEAFFGGESFLVLNGDTLIDVDVTDLVRFHEANQAAATMVLREDQAADRWGLVETMGGRWVVRINRRGLLHADPTEPRMFAGVHVMRPSLLRDIPPGQESSIIDAYVRAIERGEPILGYDHRGYWSDVGTAERYAQAQKDADAGLISPHES
jgi:NDP-sugar pyrophosphorylase family protein